MKEAYAGLWPRALAFGVDYIVIAAHLVLLVAAGVALRALAPGLAGALFGNPYAGELTGFVLITLPVTLYFALGDASARQGTWGKHKLGLRVQRLDGQRLSRPRALCRAALKFIPWELAHACIWHITFAGAHPSPLISAGFALVWLLVAANLLSLLVSRKHQTLYDWASGTVVARSAAPPPTARP